MIESRFDNLTLSEIRKELWTRRCLSDVAVGDNVFRLSLDRPYDLSKETVSKLSRSSFYLESMKGTRFDKTNGCQVNHKGYSKGNVCFNTKGLSKDDISVIISTFSSMSALEEYIDNELKPCDIMELKMLIFYIKKAHPNDTCNAMVKIIHKLMKGEL